MTDDFTDNKGVVKAYEDGYEADPASPAAQRWSKSIAKATACGLRDFLAHPETRFDVFTSYTQ